MGASTAWRTMGRLGCARGSDEGSGNSSMVMDDVSAEQGNSSDKVKSGWVTMGVFPVIMAIPFAAVAWLLA